MSKFISDSIYFTLSSYILQFGLFFVNIITKQILGPEQLGIWAVIQIILTYLVIVDLGVVDAGWKEIAYNHSKNDFSKTKQYLTSMFGYNIITSIFVSALIIIYAFTFRPDNFTFWGLVYLATTFPFFRVNNCFISYFRGISEFKLLSRINVISMLNNSLVGISLVYLWGLYGMYLAAFTNMVIITIIWYFVFKKNSTLSIEYKVKNYWPLLKIGLPMVIGGALFTIFRSLDLLFVNSSFGNKMLGYYNFGFSLSGYIFLIPNSLSVVLFSKFQEIYAKSELSNNQSDLLFKANQIQKIIAIYILPLLIGCVFFFSEFIIKNMANKFIAYIDLIRVIIIGIFPLALIHVPNQLLITQNKFKIYIIVSTIACIVLFVSLYASKVFFKTTPYMIAVITSIVYFLYSGALFVIAFHKLNKVIQSLSEYLMTVVYFISVSFMIININIINNMDQLIKSTIQYLCLIIFMLPIFYYFEKSTGIIAQLFKYIKNKRVSSI